MENLAKAVVSSWYSPGFQEVPVTDLHWRGPIAVAAKPFGPRSLAETMETRRVTQPTEMMT